ncbi:MAG: hypothetical protein ACLQHM_17250 [Limisphaerales bacterium]
MKARPSSRLSFPDLFLKLAGETPRIPAGPVGFIAGDSSGHGRSRWELGKFFKGFLKESCPLLRVMTGPNPSNGGGEFERKSYED